jgi:hypothetical protein
MDGTLTPSPSKSGGHLTPISKSPVWQPMVDFIQEGGSLLVLTNAGTFPFTQIWEPLRPVVDALPPGAGDGRVLVSPFSGAGMYVGVSSSSALCLAPGCNKDMLEDTDFTQHALVMPSGEERSTAIERERLQEVLEQLRRIMFEVFQYLAEDPTFLPLLSRKYRDLLPPVIAQRRAMGAAAFNEQVLTLPNLLEYGRFMRGTAEFVPLPLIDVQRTRTGEVVQINILATPIAKFDELFTPERRRVLRDDFELHVKRQPNSTTISKNRVNKGLPIRWMQDLGPHKSGTRHHTETFPCNSGGIRNQVQWNYGANFTLERAIALGDHPAFTDYPMACVPPMPFVSVTKRPVEESKEFPFLTKMHFLSNEEEGTAAFMRTLVQQCTERKLASPLHAADPNVPCDWDSAVHVKMACDACGVGPPPADARD